MKLAVVAGEASGDLHASEVVRELKKLDPTIGLFGIGGDFLAREGVQLLHHASELGIVGLFNVLRRLPMFRRIFADLMERIERERPDAVMLIDYPEFNLRVARRCKELGLRVVYYISPQLWAWRPGRVRHIAKYVDKMLVIFPFEAEFYEKHDVPVKYVGHPLVEQLVGVGRPQRRDQRLRIALMPGSRRHEVGDLLPPMLAAVDILRKQRDIEAYVILAPTIEHDEIESIMHETGIHVPILPHDRGEGLAAADVALSSSGTATLEAALVGTPVVVMYLLSRATYWLALRLVKVRHFSLINIVAGKRVVPELIQKDVNGARIAQEVLRMIEPANYARLRQELAHVRELLGDAGASRRAAEEIYGIMTA